MYNKKIIRLIRFAKIFNTHYPITRNWGWIKLNSKNIFLKMNRLCLFDYSIAFYRTTDNKQKYSLHVWMTHWFSNPEQGTSNTNSSKFVRNNLKTYQYLFFLFISFIEEKHCKTLNLSLSIIDSLLLRDSTLEKNIRGIRILLLAEILPFFSWLAEMIELRKGLLISFA